MSLLVKGGLVFFVDYFFYVLFLVSGTGFGRIRVVRSWRGILVILFVIVRILLISLF